tara:strand:+ start:210 stop:716 length:507 start_codon:yes stop_codon:yes gene_type:complete
MSNLRLLSETTASNSSSISITDVFTTDYDIYKITTEQKGISSETSMEARFINTSGSIITSSNYDYARLMIKSWTGNTGDQSENQNYFRSFGEASTEGATSSGWIYNPMNTQYTFYTGENVSKVSGGNFSMKCAAMLTETTQVAGINFFPDNGNAYTSFECKIYGLRRD